MQLFRNKLQKKQNIRRYLRATKPPNPEVPVKSSQLTSNLRNAHTRFLIQQVKRGFFSPRWYIVFHLKDKKERQHEDEWVKDIRHVRNMFFQSYYQGDRDWKDKLDRPKAIWGLEFGKQGITPHINLLVENTKDEWDEDKLHHFFAKELPRDLAKCVAQRKSVKVTDIKSSGIFGYINKETRWEFSPIIYSISDYEKQPTNNQLSR
tara:strand:- start:277 stop:894 length:618 start_codon:yes stop_codon:yes gene_type:complete